MRDSFARRSHPIAALALLSGFGSLATGTEAHAGAATSRESCESLRREWDNKRSAISAVGDAARERAAKEVASVHRKQVWQYVKTFKRADDIECAWRLGLELDLGAGSPELEEHLLKYLETFPEGTSRAWAASQLVSRRMRGGTPAEIDREIALFDQQHPLALLEQGQLRVQAAWIALLDELDVERAEELYGAALALPRSEQELEEARGNKGESWHEWWQEERERLESFRGSFAELGGLDLDGKAFRIGDYRGKVLMLEFWASW